MRAVLVSVRYGDMTAVTLPAWKRVLPEGSLVVATSPEDIETQAVADECGVPTVVTDAWTRIDPTCHAGGTPTFNASFGMDVALGLAEDARPRPAIGEVIVNINADCYPTGKWPADDTIHPGVLYGFWRHHCLSKADFELFVTKKKKLHDFPRMKNSGGRPVGYFQMWRYREGERFRSYPNAGKYDTHFCDRWAPNMTMRSELTLLHLGPQKDWDNWRSRVVPRWETL